MEAALDLVRHTVYPPNALVLYPASAKECWRGILRKTQRSRLFVISTDMTTEDQLGSMSHSKQFDERVEGIFRRNDGDTGSASLARRILPFIALPF